MNIEIEEIWKPIEGFDNYQVSNWGRVKSLWFGKERILKPTKIGKGYLAVCLYKGRSQHCKKYVHHLVASAFLENPHNLSCINHINEVKTDNRSENLEYCDYAFNNNWGTRNERVAKAISKAVIQLSLDGTFIREWPSAREIQRQLGFRQSNISACCNGKYKKMNGFIWKYKNEE